MYVNSRSLSDPSHDGEDTASGRDSGVGRSHGAHQKVSRIWNGWYMIRKTLYFNIKLMMDTIISYMYLSVHTRTFLMFAWKTSMTFMWIFQILQLSTYKPYRLWRLVEASVSVKPQFSAMKGFTHHRSFVFEIQNWWKYHDLHFHYWCTFWDLWGCKNTKWCVY